MIEVDLQRLKSHYRSLREHKRQLDIAVEQHKHSSIVDPQFSLIMRDIALAHQEFPDLFETVDASVFASGGTQRTRFYDVRGLRAHLGHVIARIEVAMEVEASPVIERRAFAFIRNVQLRQIVERDFDEVQRAWVAKCWKSVIVLCGGIIEAILTDVLQQRDAQAPGRHEGPKPRSASVGSG